MKYVSTQNFILILCLFNIILWLHFIFVKAHNKYIFSAFLCLCEITDIYGGSGCFLLTQDYAVICIAVLSLGAGQNKICCVANSVYTISCDFNRH